MILCQFYIWDSIPTSCIGFMSFIGSELKNRSVSQIYYSDSRTDLMQNYGRVYKGDCSKRLYFRFYPQYIQLCVGYEILTAKLLYIKPLLVWLYLTY